DPKKRLPNLPISKIGRGGIPSTYVPGRNTILLALAVSLAETEGAKHVVIGSNHLDYSGYPDCRPEFNRAFERVAASGTKAGTERRAAKIEAPLIRLDKKRIVQLAVKLGVPIAA